MMTEREDTATADDEDDFAERLMAANETVNILAAAFDGFYPDERTMNIDRTALPCNQYAVSLTLQ